MDFELFFSVSLKNLFFASQDKKKAAALIKTLFEFDAVQFNQIENRTLNNGVMTLKFIKRPTQAKIIPWISFLFIHNIPFDGTFGQKKNKTPT